MIRRLHSLAVAALLTVGAGVACQASGPLEQVGSLLTDAEVLAPALLVPQNDPRPWPSDPWTYIAHRVVGDTLLLGIQYGGGCREHRFALLVDPVFMESQPVQVVARLSHDADGDLCRALLGRTLRFDLTGLRQQFAASYGVGSGTVVIRLEGRPITYTF